MLASDEQPTQPTTVSEGNKENASAGTSAGDDDRSSDEDEDGESEQAEGSGMLWINVAQETSA